MARLKPRPTLGAGEARQVTLAHGLGIRVTAEGVETEHQLDIVRQAGCDKAQGFLLGRPVPAQDTVWLPGPARNSAFRPIAATRLRRSS